MEGYVRNGFSSNGNCDALISQELERNREPSTASRKRKKSKNGCINEGNDILVEELQKIRERLKDSTSHLSNNYRRAIASIKNHSEEIHNGKEAMQLKSIGNYIGNQIQAILQKNKRPIAVATPPVPPVLLPVSTPPVLSLTPPVQDHTNTSVFVVAKEPEPEAENVNTKRIYVPAMRKQPWYVLLAMKKMQAFSEEKAIEKQALLKEMQNAGYQGDLSKLKTCIASLMCTHAIITKTSTGHLYLSTKGVQSANLCISRSNDDVSSQSSTTTTTSSSSGSSSIFNMSQNMERSTSSSSFSSRATTPNECGTPLNSQTLSQSSGIICIDLSENEEEQEQELLREKQRVGTRVDGKRHENDLICDSDEWELVLLLDHREILSRRNRSILERKLVEKNITCQVRALSVGDMLWIVKRYRPCVQLDGSTTLEVKEFVLNVIVERKEVKDLSGSIVDKRYGEQKSRLIHSGLKQVIYLVEGSLTQQTSVRASGLETAMCRTQVQNDFFVQWCRTSDETIHFLTSVHHRLLTQIPFPKCRNKEKKNNHSDVSSFRSFFCQPVFTFDEFTTAYRKKTQFTVGEMYQRMLIQVPCFSTIKAKALAEKYPTFQALTQAMNSSIQWQQEEILYGLQHKKQRLGPKPKQFIYDLLTGG